MFCFKKHSKQTNSRDSFDSQTTIFFIIFDETFVFEIQKIKFKSSRKHYTEYLNNDAIRNSIVESKIKSLIINIRIILFARESFEILSIFLTNRLFFHINSIISISNQKTIQYFVKKSFNFQSAFDIAINSFIRKTIRKRVCWF